MASMVELITCSVCLEFYEDPLVLPCMHSFCRRCLQGVYATTRELKCPECRTEAKLGSNGINELHRNFQLDSIVDNYKREHTEDIICTDHTRPYILVCKDCDSLVCDDCITQKHSSHVFASTEETYEKKAACIGKQLTKLEERGRIHSDKRNTCNTLALQVQADMKNNIQKLDDYFMKQREFLDKREATLKSDMEKKARDAQEKYITKADAAYQKEKNVKSMVADVELLRTEHKSKFLQKYNETEARFSILNSG